MHLTKQFNDQPDTTDNVKRKGVLCSRQKLVITLVGSLLKGSLLPEVGSEVRVRPLDGGVRCLGEVTERGGLSDGRGVAIGDTSHLEELLGDGSRHDAGTTGSRDEAHGDGSALAGDLARDGMGLSELVTPVSSADRDDGDFGGDDSSTDGGGDFLRALDSESDVTVVVSDSDESLESGTLSGSGR